MKLVKSILFCFHAPRGEEGKFGTIGRKRVKALAGATLLLALGFQLPVALSASAENFQARLIFCDSPGLATVTGAG